MWNAISLGQDLNSCHPVHFQGHLRYCYIDPYLFLSRLVPYSEQFFLSMLSHPQIQGHTSFLAATLGLQNSRMQTKNSTEDWQLTVTAVGCPHPGRHSAAALCNWPLLFWPKNWDWPLLCGYMCTYNFLTPTNFRFNRRGLLTPTHRCLPVYTGASCNRFIYSAGTFGSVKSQYVTIGGARGVMVIVARIGHEFKSWTDCISHSTNTFGKGMNPIILPPSMGK